MKISVMWMTRKRSHELVYSVSSFIHNADDNANIEYICNHINKFYNK